MRPFLRQLWPALRLLAAMTLITGAAYPTLIAAVAKVMFPSRAEGSLIAAGGRIAGSRLIGQYFSSPRYFWPRPSATAPVPYNAGLSRGSNLGPTNPELLKAVQARAAALRRADPGNRDPIPVDLITASGSGLDPDISPDGALFQVRRVAKARGLPEAAVRQLAKRRRERPDFGFLGEPRVNVLLLNLDLDRLSAGRSKVVE